MGHIGRTEATLRLGPKLTGVTDEANVAMTGQAHCRCTQFSVTSSEDRIRNVIVASTHGSLWLHSPLSAVPTPSATLQPTKARSPNSIRARGNILLVLASKTPSGQGGLAGCGD